jgi:putative hemolysin
VLPTQRGHTAPVPVRRSPLVSTARIVRDGTLWVTRAVRRGINRIDRALGADTSEERSQISDTELRALVAANPTLAPEERRIIDEVLTAGARHVSAVMVPRTDVIYLDASLDVTEAVRTIRDTPHSRFPVIDGSHDDIVGFVHLRDLLMPPEEAPAEFTSVGALAREVRRVPASKHVLAALSEMRSEGHHLAVVVDEYGGTAGIVTLEDLIEELVGEIHDEYDVAPEPEPESVLDDIDGRIHLADFADRCGFELPSGPYESLGGFVMARLGRLPVVGDEVTVDGWRLVVTQCDGRRVSRVAVTRRP